MWLRLLSNTSNVRYFCEIHETRIFITRETFIHIQEDLLLKHSEARSKDDEVAELKRQNMLMRAHIEASPDGSKFVEAFIDFKSRAVKG